MAKEKVVGKGKKEIEKSSSTSKGKNTKITKKISANLEFEKEIETMLAERNKLREKTKKIREEVKKTIVWKKSCLLEFSVSNYKSIADKLVLKFNNNANDIDRVFAIMGKNASGKSNILKALEFFVKSIKKGGINIKDEIHFKLQEEYKDKPIKFFMSFIIGENKYSYVIEMFLKDKDFESKEIDSKYIIGEEILTKNNEILIDRTNKVINENKLRPNTFLSDEYKDIDRFKEKIFKEAQLENSLLIAELRNYFNDILDIYINFIDKFIFDLKGEERIDIGKSSIDIIEELDNNSELKKFVVESLSKLDNNVYDLMIKKTKVSREDFFDLEEHKKSEYLAGGAKINMDSGKFEHYLFDIRTLHKTNKGNDIIFKINEENSGLNVIILMLINIFKIMDKGGILVVDELEVSLQYYIMEYIIMFFYEKKEIVEKLGQIIFITHNPLILYSLEIANIWIVDKEYQGTSLENLEEKIDIDDDDSNYRNKLMNDYLTGNLDAAPLLLIDRDEE